MTTTTPSRRQPPEVQPAPGRVADAHPWSGSAADRSASLETIDLVAGTQTTVGATWTVTVPGEGAILIEAGRLVFDGNGPPVFIAGPHRPPPETIATLCRALR